MDTYVVQFPSRAFSHIAPPWAQALHACPTQWMRMRPSYPSDDLMLTESDLEAMVHSAFADQADPHASNQRSR